MNSIKIKGMSCQHCVASVKEALEKIPEISNVTVDLDQGEASYEGAIDIQQIEDAISSIGFEVV